MERFDRRGLLIAAGALATAAAPSFGHTTRPVHVRGARWFTGEAFVARDFWIVGERMTFAAPRGDAAILDVSGKWLVPPFADAHSHSFGEGRPTMERERASAYVRDGVLYVMSHANAVLDRAAQRAVGVNVADGPEVIFANGLLTAHDSPVPGFYRAIVLPTGAHPGTTPEGMADRLWFEIDDVAELDRKWPAIRAQRSDFVKVYLHNSERDPKAPLAPFFKGFGMTPEVVRAVVRKAHAERLRVSAHVATAGDIVAALDAGVDMLGHVTDGPITAALADRVAKSSIPLVTTMAFRVSQVPPPAKAILENNLRLLATAGARLVIGADVPRDTGTAEVAYLRTTGLWDDAALLQMWSITTPRAIFPKRRLGGFEEGAEASFLVLPRDPLADWTATRAITARVKQGNVLAT